MLSASTSETFPRDLDIVPIVEGTTEIIPRLAADGWWKWPGDEGYRGRVHTFREGGIVNVLITEDGKQQIFAPGLVEVGRKMVGKKLHITFRPQTAPQQAPSPAAKQPRS